MTGMLVAAAVALLFPRGLIAGNDHTYYYRIPLNEMSGFNLIYTDDPGLDLFRELLGIFYEAQLFPAMNVQDVGIHGRCDRPPGSPR